MWLLNTTTLGLEEFFDGAVPPYSILSHTWSIPNEVSFVEMQNRDRTVWSKSGFAKIATFCRISKERGYSYGWVDTCCVDKRNSADLTEAINSMYRYYSEAGVCLIHLADVASTRESDIAADWEHLYEHLKHSRWFTRGWTLQELIAPRRRCFFASDWSEIIPDGDNDPRLLAALERLTGIEMPVLVDPGHLVSVCTAQRMSWASRRQTTRGEDLAYSLMGLFNISMPVLYGEGAKKAFRRLQEEIIRTSFDQSIFVWRSSAGPSEASSGLLAESPADFADPPQLGIWGPENLAPFSMTNVGLSIRMNLIQVLPQDLAWVTPDIPELDLAQANHWLEMTDPDEVYMALVTSDVLDDDGRWAFLALYLRPIPASTFLVNGKTCDGYRRVKCDTWTAVPLGALAGRTGLEQFRDVLVLEDQHYSLIQHAITEGERKWAWNDEPDPMARAQLVLDLMSDGPRTGG